MWILNLIYITKAAEFLASCIENLSQTLHSHHTYIYIFCTEKNNRGAQKSKERNLMQMNMKRANNWILLP